MEYRPSSLWMLRSRIGKLVWVSGAVSLASLSGCAVKEVAPPQPLPALPTIYTDANRIVAPSSEVPVAVNFKASTQIKLQAAQHWAKIAEDAARSVAAPLRKAGKCDSSFDPCKAVFVNPPANVTEFSRAFHNQLITTLVRSEIPVAKAPQSELTLDIDVQPILFSPNRPQYRYAGVATQLGPGVWALRDVVSVDPSDANAVPPTVDALHWFRSEFASGQTPQFEILVTVSVGSKDRYLARSTNAYYVVDGDRHLYDQEICSLIRPCAARGRAGDAPPISQIGVVGDCPLDKCIDTGSSVEVADKPRAKKK